MKNKCNELIKKEFEVNELFSSIKELVINSRSKVYRAVNQEMLNLYWNIGKMLSSIQRGSIRAAYGEQIIASVSKLLTEEFGNGFSIQNLRKMRHFYRVFQIRSTLSSELSWSHYVEIIKIDNELKRNFYIQECINSNWSVRELERQIDSLLYERLALSSNKDKVLELSKKG